MAVSLLGLVGGKGEKELNDAVSVAVAKESNGFYSKMFKFFYCILMFYYIYFFIICHYFLKITLYDVHL